MTFRIITFRVHPRSVQFIYLVLQKPIYLFIYLFVHFYENILNCSNCSKLFKFYRCNSILCFTPVKSNGDEQEMRKQHSQFQILFI